MQKITRYLVSKYLGRVVATVVLDRPPRGVVCLCAGCPNQPTMRFGFSLDAVLRRCGQSNLWPETAIRLAVSQAHHRYAKCLVPAHDRFAPLNTDIRPWIGDLLRAPYCGATLGVEAAFH